MKHNSTSFRIVTRLFVFFAVTLCASSAGARVYIDITSPYLKQIPIAVPYLDASPKTFENDLLGRKISEILSRDLAFHGFLAVLDPNEYGGRSDTDWTQFRLDYLVKGVLGRNSDSLAVDLRLFDMGTASMVEGRRYTGGEKDCRVIAHRFCDLVIRAITGDPGVSLSRLAFVVQKGRVKEVFSSEFDGSFPKEESFDKGLTLSPRYSPDGRYLAYTSFKGRRPQLYVKDLATGRSKRVAGFSGLNIAPAWHPDSRHLAVTLSKDGNPDLYVIDLEGRIKSKLTNGPTINVSPTWSPDGKRLAYVSDQTGVPQVYVMNVDSRSGTRLTYSGSYNTDPQWSPRGDRLAYTGRVEGAFQIFTIDPNGGEPTQLTYSGNNEDPCWSPDGRQMVFTSNRQGGNALFAMYANGTGQRLLVRLGDGIQSPDWGPNKFE